MCRNIDVIGVPFDLGGGRSGAAAGPAAFIESGILNELEMAGHTVAYKDLAYLLEPPPPLYKKARTQYANEVSGAIAALAAHTFVALRLGHTPLVLGGDHSIAVGSIGAALNPDLLRGKTLGLVWIDAHYDAHTGRTSVSGHANGMPLASLLGRGSRALRAPIGCRKIHPKNVLHVGAGKADCEPEEIALLRRLGLQYYTDEDICSDGVLSICDAYDSLCTRVDAVWVSFDLDAANKFWAPGVAFPNTRGFEYQTLFQFVDHLASCEKIIGADIVEYVPEREVHDAFGSPQTAMLATDFATRLFK